MIKVYSMPTPGEASNDTSNAINQIVLRLQKALPKYGVEIVSSRGEADLVAGHAGQTDGSACQVCHCHGLYPTSEGAITVGWHWAANAHVVNNLVGARAITVPSQWVADILRRDMHVDPHVIGWAIDPDEWEPGTNEGYVLWGKTRTDGVCSPEPVLRLAQMAPQTRFLTTFGEGTPNVRTTGRVPFETMRGMIRNAAVYLATTKETFGIQTLEAMASGVPVLGFRHGGTADIVEHGVTGYLVTPGDYDALLEGLDYCLKHRDVLGANARAVALTYTWDRVAEQFAEIYKAALQPHVGPKVSVVIPLHNYQSFVADAVKSVAEQEIKFSAELIIVDDGSTDNSYTAAFEALAKHNSPSIETQLIKQVNGGVASARNKGISLARGQYIVCLDADDRLGDPRFLQTLADSLDSNSRLGIVFTGLRFMDADGNLGAMANWPHGYDYDEQTIGHNQVPTCCMFRREAWTRAGGYRRKYTPAEDADLWLRIGSLGYKAAQVTPEGWFHYRMHGASLSSTVRTGERREPNWHGDDKPWIQSGQRPFASDGKVRHSWPVRNYDKPKVSIIIPVGPYHRDVVREALDSVESQTEQYWECIVVNDSGDTLDLTGFPFVREINTGGNRGASVARNMGVQASRAAYITFLDADDVLAPTFLEKTIRAYAIHGKYVYTDWNSLNKDGVLERHETPEFDLLDVFRRTSIHSINILIPKADLIKIGLFDEGMPSWEDTDLFMKMAAAGICGVRVPEPLITYRYQSGQLRERGETMKADLLALLRSRYGDYMTGAKTAMCCGSGAKGKKASIEATAEALSGGTGMVRIQYNGPTATHEVIGLATKKRYGRREAGDVFFVYLEDHQMNPDMYQPIGTIDTVEETPVPPEPTLINEKVTA